MNAQTPCLRWRARRGCLRPAAELIRTEDYDVVKLPTDAAAKAFVVEHHYSGSYPAARWRFGLYRRGVLMGVAVFSHPTNNAVITKTLGVRATDGVELGRLVLLDEVPGNGESWFVGRCLRELRREGLAGVVSFSDPVPRATVDGRVVMPGHVGCVYQACNANYQGRGTARTLRLLPDGRVFSDRAAQKIRAREQGWEYAVAQLVDAGAHPLTGDPRSWLKAELARVTRPLRHPGNHRYVWALSKAVARTLAPSQPYPRRSAA